ncbi:MAG: Cof-type HAD-IIB family hydrolase [Oscillospiraceae bacterium]
MKKDLSKYLIVSDVDGTLMRAGKPIPRANTEYIRQFIEKGGNFTLCTGRGVQATRALAKELGLRIPVILCNGGILYDFSREKAAYQRVLDPDYKTLVEDIVSEFPDVGYELIGGDDIYTPRNNEQIDSHLSTFGLHWVMQPLGSISRKMNKILFAAESGTIEKIIVYYEKRASGDPVFRKYVWAQTSPTYFEVMPSGVNKGAGLMKLAELLGIKQRNTSAIGDFQNDLPLLEAAGTAVVVANAPDWLKKKADVVVGECLDGGVGQYISRFLV